jgi:hypothetical protein
MLVLDASVAVKWFVPEERRPEARAILAGGEELVAPEIIVAEVGTGLSRKARLGDIPAAAARGALIDWLAVVGSGAVVLTPIVELLEEAYEISIALDHQLPDCLYLALARQSECPLVTADAQLARKAKGLKGVEVQVLGA